MEPKYLNWFTSPSTCPLIHNMLVGGVGLLMFDEDFAFIGADFRSTSCCCFHQSFGELLEFFSSVPH